MTPAAQKAQLNFVRLVAEEPSSLYFEDFLREGYHAWPARYQQRFPGLASWTGIRGLKHSLQSLAGVPNDWRTILASRSLSLLSLGASCMFRVCRNVLTTDLSWPTYQLTIANRAVRTGNHVVIVPIRHRILREDLTGTDMAIAIAKEFVRQGCDGLFLPAVDHLGIRLPIAEIIQHIKVVAELRFVIVDAAQAFCHIQLDESVTHADFIVAGCHKWMGAYLPLGVAFYGQRRSCDLINRRVRLPSPGRREDPLTCFVEQLDGSPLLGQSETVSLPSLFAAAGAVTDQRTCRDSREETSAEIAELLASAPQPNTGWNLLTTAPELQTRIAIMERERGRENLATADEVRRDWLAAGCIVTGYDGGIARLAFSRADRQTVLSDTCQTSKPVAAVA